MNTKLISVIIPIYNVEEYLPRCLDSVINQTYANIEILLVNDGSPDNSGEICDEYSLKDKRIKVFHIPNGGVGKARQLGVEKSSGEYIVFVDPDDWLPLDSIEVLYKEMTDDVDIVIGGYTKVGMLGNKDCLYAYDLLSTEQYVNTTLRCKINPSPWARLFRKSLLKHTTFPPFKMGQDMLMNFELSIHVRNVRFVNKSVYFYFERDNSSLKRNKSTFEYEKSLAYFTYDLFEKNNLSDKYIDSLIAFSFKRIYKRVFDYEENLNVNDEWCKKIRHYTLKKKTSYWQKVLRVGLKYKIVYNIIRSIYSTWRRIKFFFDNK